MRDRRLAWLLAAVTLSFVVAAWFDVTPWLRGPDEWRWTLQPTPPAFGRLILPALMLIAYVGLCACWLRAWEQNDQPARNVERGFLIFLTLAAPIIQTVLASAALRHPLSMLFQATVSPAVTGYYSVAVTTPDLPGQLPQYATFMQILPIHPQTHPPGLVLSHWLGWQLFERALALSDALALPLRTLQCHNTALMTLDNAQIASATLGMSVPLIGAFAVWPLYAFGRRVAGARAAAVVSALFPVLPLFAAWPGQWDQVYPLLFLAALYLAHTSLERTSARRAFATGGVLSLATFLSAGNAILVIGVGLYAGVWLWLNRSRRWLRLAVAFAAGGASIWLAYMLLYRVSVSDMIEVASRLFHESTRCPICPSTTRSYGVWLLWNPIDFATFFSLPLTILLLTRLLALIRSALRRDPPGDSARVALTVAALTPFVALVVAGIVRGEVGRMWGYFGPVFGLLALAPSTDASPRRRDAVWLIGLVALQLAMMSTRWLVTPSFLDEPPERTANFALPEPQVKTQASFDRQIALLGYDVAEVSGALDVTLYWQALAQPPHAYTVFVHVLNEEGQPVGQQDNMPVNDQLPTSCWRPGEVVADTRRVTLAEGASPASIDVGLYQLETGQRLSVDDGSGTSVRLNVP